MNVSTLTGSILNENPTLGTILGYTFSRDETRVSVSGINYRYKFTLMQQMLTLMVIS